MKKQDWLASCAVALVVALTMVVAGPKMGVADPTSIVTVPALPSTSMTIPTINAEVSATTTTDPGKGVIVKVALKSPSGAGVTEVPVTITVSRTTMYPMSRSMASQNQVTQLAEVCAAIPVGVDGNGTADVELPLTWETPAPVVPQVAPVAGQVSIKINNDSWKPATTYQMTLSSPQLGVKAAPTTLTGPVGYSVMLQRQDVGRTIVDYLPTNSKIR